MGSWYDNLKPIRKPDYITIRPTYNRKLEIRLQYNSPRLHNKTIIIDEEVGLSLKDVDVNVSKGERWGDWGGPIKCGDVIYVTKSLKRKKKNMSKGHLIIHDISKAEAKALMKTLKNYAHWWPQDQIAILDSAAMFAILTHGYPTTNPEKILELNKKKEFK